MASLAGFRQPSLLFICTPHRENAVSPSPGVCTRDAEEVTEQEEETAGRKDSLLAFHLNKRNNTPLALSRYPPPPPLRSSDGKENARKKKRRGRRTRKGMDCDEEGGTRENERDEQTGRYQKIPRRTSTSVPERTEVAGLSRMRAGWCMYSRVFS